MRERNRKNEGGTGERDGEEGGRKRKSGEKKGGWERKKSEVVRVGVGRVGEGESGGSHTLGLGLMRQEKCQTGLCCKGGTERWHVTREKRFDTVKLSNLTALSFVHESNNQTSYQL